MNTHSMPINLLWTGGWDSTFRLLQLIVDYRQIVQPIYIIDTARASTLQEMDTRTQIISTIITRYPFAKELILPTSYFALSDIQKHSEITEKYKTLKRKLLLGSQYDWLARFSHQYNIKNLELSIEKSDRQTHFKDSTRFTLNNASLAGEIYSLSKDIKANDPMSLFSCFHFPILNFTKVDMRQHSKNAGYLDIMDATWFCFTPINGKPCGLCNPCRNVVVENMGYRLPKSALLRNKFRKAYDLEETFNKTVKRQVRKVFPSYT